jgi:hypothetical protein
MSCHLFTGDLKPCVHRLCHVYTNKLKSQRILQDSDFTTLLNPCGDMNKYIALRVSIWDIYF